MKNTRKNVIFQILKGHDENSGLTAMEIQQALESEGIHVNLRSVRRDITDLSGSHGVGTNEGRPERFYPTKDFKLKYDLQLDEGTLQTLMIALNNLKCTSHEYFNQYASDAESVILDSLSTNISKELRESKERYYFDYSNTGKPLANNFNDFEKIMIAIRQNRIITCINDSPYKNEKYNQKIRKFAPYVFILNSGTPYLIVQDIESSEFKKLRLTRIHKVVLSKDSFTRVDLKNILNLKNSIGGWGGIAEETIKVSITCDPEMATYFKEKTIHSSQILKKLDSSNYLLEFECAHGSNMIRLISSFGGSIINIEPQEIFDEVKDIWKSGLKNAS